VRQRQGEGKDLEKEEAFGVARPRAVCGRDEQCESVVI
jgi:hypothetical protein